MKKPIIAESKGNTFYIKSKGIPKGCQICLKGAKVVLFINGICQKPPHCSWYCPISEERRGKETTFADEIKITTKEELLEEINKINAKGMSITGGEPLLERNLEKTIEFIKYTKLIKGKKFHIHLYTNSINFNKVISEKLITARLDEIRFHLPLNEKDEWEKIKFAINSGLSVGAEVPIIPNDDYVKTLEKFIFYLDSIGTDFVNLNEFEYCFSNSQSLKERGFHLKEGTIASVENSKEMALDFIKKLAPKVSLKIHFCSIRAKDYYQLKNRYLRRAKTIRLPYEEISEEGLLLHCQIEGNRKDLEKLNYLFLSKFKIPKKYISFKVDNIKLPYYFAIDNQFISLLDDYKLKGYIVEATPFRRENYRQITEKTPIKLFKQEIGINEN